ncbi:MAG: potassium-transporting ATPase subunit F [Phycisphaerales bacterium]
MTIILMAGIASGATSSVDWIHLLGAVVAIALLAYLLCAMLKPEWFQ